MKKALTTGLTVLLLTNNPVYAEQKTVYVQPIDTVDFLEDSLAVVDDLYNISFEVFPVQHFPYNQRHSADAMMNAYAGGNILIVTGNTLVSKGVCNGKATNVDVMKACASQGVSIIGGVSYISKFPALVSFDFTHSTEEHNINTRAALITHELGHALGAGHCENDCIMNDTFERNEETKYISLTFCEEHKKTLDQYLRQ